MDVQNLYEYGTFGAKACLLTGDFGVCITQGYRSRLRILPRAPNVSFAFMVQVDCRNQLSVSCDKGKKGFTVEDVDISTDPLQLSAKP